MLPHWSRLDVEIRTQQKLYHNNKSIKLFSIPSDAAAGCETKRGGEERDLTYHTESHRERGREREREDTDMR